MSESGAFELSLETPDFKLSVRRGSTVIAEPAPLMLATPAALPAPVAATPAPAVEEKENPYAGCLEVKSPIVGTFYRSPSPEAPAYAAEGDRIRTGQVLCIIEAMKLMNEIEAEFDGIVRKVLADNAEPVEYGQPLFLIEPEHVL